MGWLLWCSHVSSLIRTSRPFSFSVDGERIASRGFSGMKPASCSFTNVWKMVITSGRISLRICWKYLLSSFAGSQRGCPYHSQGLFKKFILPIASDVCENRTPNMSLARSITGFAGFFVV